MVKQGLLPLQMLILRIFLETLLQRTADSLTAYLFRHPEMKRFGALPAEIRAYTTGDPALVTQLASLFRISLSRGKTIISMEDELKHARNYMNIQKFLMSGMKHILVVMKKKLKKNLVNS